MNDIEKQIEGDFEEEENDFFEEGEMKGRINHTRNDNKKKVILYVVLGLFAVIIIGLIIYIIMNNKDEKTTDEPVSKEEKEVVKEENTNNTGYVSCDDNTSLLNVRNSTTGDIIDGLSCFQEVTIEEELEKTDNCDKWYKISYKKHDNNYTGYACSTYIKNMETKSSTIQKVKDVIDKANDYYETTTLFPYCGKTSDIKTINIKEDGGNFDGQYVKSEFKNTEELKSYINSFLDNSLITGKIELSDYNNPKMYDDYYEIDGNLYCRKYSGKGFLTRYTDNYNIEVIEETENKIKVKIAYEYITEETQQNEDTKCKNDKVELCSNSQLEYKLGNIEIIKKDDNYIINKFDFHK